MKLLLLLSALLASLTGLGTAARAQAVAVEQVLARAGSAICRTAVSDAGWRAVATAYRATDIAAARPVFAIVATPIIDDRLRV